MRFAAELITTDGSPGVLSRGEIVREVFDVLPNNVAGSGGQSGANGERDGRGGDGGDSKKGLRVMVHGEIPQSSQIAGSWDVFRMRFDRCHSTG